MSGRSGQEEKDEAPTLRKMRQSERQQRVRQYLARKLQVSEIAALLHCSKRVVQKDIAAIRSEMAAELSRESVLDFATRYLRQSDARDRELWLLYERAKNGQKAPKEQQGPPGSPVVWLVQPDLHLAVKLLAELRKNAKEELASLQSLGVVHKAPEEVMLGVKVYTSLDKLPASVLDDLADCEDHEEFARRLAHHIGDANAQQLLSGPIEGAVPPRALPRAADQL